MHDVPARHFGLLQAIKEVSSGGTEAIAVVYNSRARERHHVRMHGNTKDRSFVLHLRERGGAWRPIAQAHRTLSARSLLTGARYALTVQPSVDVAMCVLLCIVFDDFRRMVRKRDVLIGTGIPELLPVLFPALTP